MQIETCPIGTTLRLDAATRLVILSRESGRVVLSAIAPAGTRLLFDGVSLNPQRGCAGAWTFLFSLQTVRRFVLGQLWLPGEVVELASACMNAVHLGITTLPAEPACTEPATTPLIRPPLTSPPPPPAVVATPWHTPRAAGGGDLLEIRVCH